MTFEKLKKDYLNTPIPTRLEEKGWNELVTKLDLPSRGPSFNYYLRRSGFALAVLFIFATLLISQAQAAGPGDILYPVKVLSDQIKAGISNHPETAIQNRAKDVVKETKQDSPEKLDQAVKAYNNTIDQSKNQIKDEDQKEQVQHTLKEQEDQFEELKKDNPGQDKLDEVIEQTKKAQGEVRGESTQSHEDNSEHENSNSNSKSQSK